MNATSIFISAGEASGDLHGALLIQELKTKYADLKLSAMGGKHLEQAGCHLVADYHLISVVGITEVLKNLAEIRKTYKIIKNHLLTHKPNFIILIDFPGFNLILAKLAKKIGITVIYYIPPQLWAWKEKRIKKIKQYVDYVFVIYPFEVEFYKKHGIQAFYKKNPLLSEVVPDLSREEFCQKYQLNPEHLIIGVAPGSRMNEIDNIFQTLVETMKNIKNKEPSAQFVIPIAPNFTKTFIQEKLKNHDILNITLIENDRINVFFNCDGFVAVSGTVTVEIALARKPCVVVYKVSKITYLIGRLLIKVKFISLLNIILNKMIFPEFIQSEAQAENIATEILRILKDPYRYGETLIELDKFRQELETCEEIVCVKDIPDTLLQI